MDTDNAPASEQPAQPAIEVAPPVLVPEEAYDLDLDLIDPQTKKVKLGQAVYEVYPPKVKDLAGLMRLAGRLQSGASPEADVTQMIEIFKRLMPALNDDKVDLSMAQVMALFKFITEMASPTENSALKALGVEPTQEKKVVPVS